MTDQHQHSLHHVTMPTTKTHEKPVSKAEGKQEQQELEELLKLIKVYPKNELKSSLEAVESSRQSCRWPLPLEGTCKDSSHIHTEAQSLEKFSLRYFGERVFSPHPQHKYFKTIFSSLVNDRLSNSEWSSVAPPENILRVLICLRILMRDPTFQREFHKLGAIPVLAQHLAAATESYLLHGDGPFVVDILKEIANIFQKLSCVEEQRVWLIGAGVQRSLVLLLSASDVIVLHCSMHTLIRLAQSPEPRSKIAELNCIEILLTILQDYDILSKKLAAKLLLVLCVDPWVRDLVKVHDGVPILLSLLHLDSAGLLYHVIYCLAHLAKDDAISAEIRNSGGVPLILSLLSQDRKFVPERSITNTNRTPSAEEVDELQEQSIMLKCACCSCITELSVSDTNAQQVVQANGIYFLSLLVLPQGEGATTLQANAFRALRFLFSLERNRRMFKRVFPADLFEMFIDIGHYKRDLKAYSTVVKKINELEPGVVREMEESVLSLNLTREPMFWVGDYAVMEHLGSGAFGSVYRVNKRNARHTQLAMKDINTMSSAFGKNKNERLQSAGNIMTELNVIKEQLKHPNIVKYRQTFFHGERLYIVMDLIEGAPLFEHFNSLKEKKQTFSEARIWKIFVQLVLALRYLHKDKRIVHRDLTPNNIMLGEGDKVTITDFGAAKHKSKDCSKMMSVVGTILYSSPELIQNHAYDEKVDIWALGCILYQMATLEAPFFSSNIILLAKLIVEAKYEPVPEGQYSELVISTIKRCISPDPEIRPDVVQVAGHISERILIHMDAQQRTEAKLQRKLDKEYKRTRQHICREPIKSGLRDQKLYLVSVDQYDKLVNLQSSGGAAGIRDEGMVSVRDILLSDDSSQLSGVSGDEDSTSSGSCSGSDSREGSAGRRRLPRPPSGENPQLRRQLINSLYSQQLNIVPVTSRDSGIGSGDPSPNGLPLDCRPSQWDDISRSPILRSMSTPAVDVAAKLSPSTGRVRPSSATSSKLKVSSDKVRKISADPIQELMHQLHKLIYISQMPPPLCPSPNRRVIERYKRALFAPSSASINLKTELKKLQTLSTDIIDLNLGDPSHVTRDKTGHVTNVICAKESESRVTIGNGSQVTLYDPDEDELGITYERLHSMIERVLLDSGYYEPQRAGVEPRAGTFTVHTPWH